MTFISTTTLTLMAAILVCAANAQILGGSYTNGLLGGIRRPGKGLLGGIVGGIRGGIGGGVSTSLGCGLCPTGTVCRDVNFVPTCVPLSGVLGGVSGGIVGGVQPVHGGIIGGVSAGINGGIRKVPAVGIDGIAVPVVKGVGYGINQGRCDVVLTDCAPSRFDRYDRCKYTFDLRSGKCVKTYVRHACSGYSHYSYNLFDSILECQQACYY